VTDSFDGLTQEDANPVVGCAYCSRLYGFKMLKVLFIDIKQLLNGSQYKMPAYLGGVSVCVCFMAAVVSLGLTLIIVPRQVTPWTGLLLMYEWAFTIFYILFGGYLSLIYHWGKIMASRTPSSLSQPESSDDDSGKGMFSRNCFDLAKYFSFNHVLKFPIHFLVH
jgi:hypothetical protein